MKRFQRISLGLMKLGGGSLAFLLILIGFVWFFPGLLLNSTTLSWSKKLLNRGDNHIEWNEGTLSAKSTHFREKKLSLHLSDLCLKLKSPEIEGCFSLVDIKLGFLFKGIHPELSELGPIHIQSNEFRYRETPSKVEEKKTETNSTDWLTLPKWFANLEPKFMNIRFKKWEVETKAVRAKGEFSLRGNTNQGISHYQSGIQGTVVIQTEKSVDRYSLSGDLHLDTDTETKWKSHGEIAIRESKKKNAVLTFAITPKDSRLEYALGAKLAQLPLKASLIANGWVDRKELKSKIDVVADKPVDVLESVSLKACDFSIGFGKPKSQLNFECPILASVPVPRAQDLPIRGLIRKLNGHVKLQAAQIAEKGGSKVEANLDLKVDPLFSEIKQGTAHLVLDVDGKTEDPIERWHYNLNSDLKGRDVKKITNMLAKTSWATPEPFAELEGPFELNIRGESDSKRGIQLPLTLTTHFHSVRQKLDIEAKGSLQLGAKNAKNDVLDLDVVLKDVQLVLPPVDPYRLPRPIPDSRIEREVQTAEKIKAKETERPFDLRMRIKADGNRPIRLISNLSKEPIPLVLDVHMSKDDPLVGVVELKPFNVELFRRNAKIETMKVGLKRNPEFNIVHGKVEIAYLDYTITILIDGLLDRPSVHFQSDPPLSDKQVIAVLLFGRTMDALDSDQMQSVGNARSAFADGAIGLASMYALASTPVESIGYDGISKEFSAKIKLADKTSMTIGTDLKRLKTLGVRRKLGSHWDINSYLENPFFATERSLTTFLEWNWRY